MILYLEGNEHDQEAAKALLQEQGFNVSLLRGDNTASAGLFETAEDSLPLAFLEHSIDGIVILDAETVGVLYANNAFAEMLGYRLDEIRRLKVWDWDVVWSRKEIEGMFASRNWPGERFETRHRNKDGQLLDVAISLKAIFWRGKEVVFCMVRDIGERTTTERALRLAQFTVENTGDQAFWITPEGRLFYVNQAACAALGYSREELEGMALWDIDPHVTRENADDYWQQVKKNGLMRFERVHRAKDGRIYPVEIRGNYVNFDGKEFSCAFVTDISERKQAEQQLRQANLVLENSPAVVFCWGASDDWPVEMVSRNVTQFGYTPEELLSGAVSYAALVHPEDLDQLVAELHAQIDCGEQHFQHEYRIVTRQGEVRWVDERTLIERDADGRVSAYQGVVMDISERKASEEALRRSEERYRQLMEMLPIAAYTTDAEGRINFFNRRAQELWQREPELYSDLWCGSFKLHYPNGQPMAHDCCPMALTLKTGEACQGQEIMVENPDGSCSYALAYPELLFGADGQAEGAVNLLFDITERKKAEQQLRQANRVLENSPAVLFRWKAQAGWPVEMVTRNVNCFGYSSEELLSGEVPYAELVHSEDVDRVAAELRDYTIRGQDRFQQEYRIVTREGAVRWVDDRTVVERDATGLVTHYQGIVVDVTERKRTEEALEKRLVALTRPLDDASSVSFGELFNPADIQHLQDDFARATGVASLITLPDGTPLTEPSNFCRLCDIIRATEKGTAKCMMSDATLGRPSAAAPIVQQCLSAGLWGAGAAISVGGRHIANWLIGQVRDESITEEQMRAYARQVAADEEAMVEAFLEVPIMSRERFGQVAQALYTLAQQLSSIAYQNVQQARFITDHKQAEEALRESECRYRSIVEHAPFGITRSTRDGQLLSVNPALATMLKYDSAQELQETIARSSIQEVLFPRPSERESLVKQILFSDSWQVYNNRLRCKDGSIVTCRVHSRRITDEAGQTSAFESYQENITDQLAAEQALRESEEKFRVLAETSPVAISLYHGKHVTYANPAMERLFGYSAEELRQLKYWDWVHEDHQELVRSRAQARLAGEPVPSQYEFKCVTKDGEVRDVLVSAGTMSHQGTLSGVASFLDISERKQAEELIRASLMEKEVLLKEIHHRVKNNLQVVSSLLFLQAQKFKDPELQNCFLESQSRICSMALAHEQLYQSKNLAEVSIRNYVESLVEQLQQIFLSPGQEEIDCRLEVDDLELDIEKVVPCGLLITELLSNAYKHAFVDGRSGQVTVSLQRRAGQIELAVADDGVGLPADFDYAQATTLGLQLVSALANQLGGTLVLETDVGTRFRVCFAG